MHDADDQKGAIPLVVDPSRGYRAKNLEWVQGLYMVATGVWPLVSPRTFQAVTGPKRELWLTKTVGALAAVTGGVLLYAASRRRRPSEVILLAMGNAVAFTAIDVVYVAKRRIAPIYLVDAVAQLGLLACWTFGRGHLPWRPRRNVATPISTTADALERQPVSPV
jgi:peptidoglycan/LPS O-acetylase OafA/YrhL